jgi:hypothetical protein
MDGTPILAWSDGVITTVAYEKDRFGYFGWQLCQPGVYSEDDEWGPVFWMPLPEPPKQEGRA